MATAESVKDKIQSLIEAANAVTGRSDTNLTSAMLALAATSGQSDLAENDPESPAFVKNRTHFDSREEVEYFSVVIDEDTDLSNPFLQISTEPVALEDTVVEGTIIGYDTGDSSAAISLIEKIDASSDFGLPDGSFVQYVYGIEDFTLGLISISQTVSVDDIELPRGVILMMEGITLVSGTALKLRSYKIFGELKQLDPKYIKDMYYEETIWTPQPQIAPCSWLWDRFSKNALGEIILKAVINGKDYYEFDQNQKSGGLVDYTTPDGTFTYTANMLNETATHNAESWEWFEGAKTVHPLPPKYLPDPLTDSEGNKLATEAFVLANAGGGASAEWEQIANYSLAEATQTIEFLWTATPMKRIKVELSTPAAAANATHLPLRVYTGEDLIRAYSLFYPTALPKTAATTMVYDISAQKIGENNVVEIEELEGNMATHNRGFYVEATNKQISVGNSPYGTPNPTDTIFGIYIQTYGSFDVGTTLKIWGTRA